MFDALDLDCSRSNGNSIRMPYRLVRADEQGGISFCTVLSSSRDGAQNKVRSVNTYFSRRNGALANHHDCRPSGQFHVTRKRRTRIDKVGPKENDLAIKDSIECECAHLILTWELDCNSELGCCV